MCSVSPPSSYLVSGSDSRLAAARPYSYIPLIKCRYSLCTFASNPLGLRICLKPAMSCKLYLRRLGPRHSSHSPLFALPRQWRHSCNPRRKKNEQRELHSRRQTEAAHLHTKRQSTKAPVLRAGPSRILPSNFCDVAWTVRDIFQKMASVSSSQGSQETFYNDNFGSLSVCSKVIKVRVE